MKKFIVTEAQLDKLEYEAYTFGAGYRETEKELDKMEQALKGTKAYLRSKPYKDQRQVQFLYLPDGLILNPADIVTARYHSNIRHQSRHDYEAEGRCKDGYISIKIRGEQPHIHLAIPVESEKQGVQLLKEIYSQKTKEPE